LIGGVRLRCWYIWILLIVFSGPHRSVGFGAECHQPVLLSVFPPELRIVRDGGSRSVTLFGRDLGLDATWHAEGESSRCTSQIWVGKGDLEDPWEIALDGVDGEGPVVLRQRGEGWGRLEFSGADWLGDTGSLVVMVVRGRTRMDGTFSEAGRSEAIVVSVVESPVYELIIDRVVPPAVRPGSRGAVVRLEGRFTWDSEVELNGEPVSASFIDPGGGVIEVGLRADQLDDERSHVVTVRNSDGIRSDEAVILVAEPTRIKKSSPSRLRSGRSGQTVKLQFEGVPPEQVDIRYQPAAGIEYRLENPGREDFPEGAAKAMPSRTGTVTASSILIGWTEVEARVRKNEISFRVDADQVPGPGSLIVKLSGPTGESAAVFMIEGSNADSSLIPDYEGGPPEKDHNFKTRDKY
jgi:hypothetical protein